VSCRVLPWPPRLTPQRVPLLGALPAAQVSAFGRLAVASQPRRLIARAIRKTRMIVPNVVEPVHLFLSQKHRRGQAVHGCVAPALVEEAAGLVQVLKVVQVALRPPETQVSNLKVGSEMTRVVVALVVSDPSECVVLGDELGVMLTHKALRGFPKRRNSLAVIVVLNPST